MNVAIGMWVLLLSAGVLDAPVDEATPNAAQEPPATTAPIIPPQQAPRRIPPAQPPAQQSGAGRDLQNREPPLPNVPSDRRRGTSAARSQPERNGAALPDMPLAPTEPSGPAEGRASGWVPPTESGQVLGAKRTGSAAAARESPAGTTRSHMPLPPTLRAADLTGAGLSPAARNAPGRTGAYYASSTSAYAVPQPLPEKPFAAYRSMPGVSPYLNLFRNDTSGGTIDNYSTIVRPQLEQRFFNQQIGRDVRGLERDSRALQQMGHERAPQGVATPQFYMNYGNFYPVSSGELGP